MSAVFRFAPSPNGRLHLGHAYSALLNEKLAHDMGGRLLLRIEDIDTTRCTPALTQACMDDLAWLGLKWETPVRVQSQHFADYAAALKTLEPLLYPCFCSRSELKQHIHARDPDGAALYAGTCRQLPRTDARRRIDAGEAHSWRLDMSAALRAAPAPHYYTRFDSHFDTGAQVRAQPERWGDVIIARKETPTSYHLSVVVDDALQGITHVVRGEDLEAATDIHVLLQALLGLPQPLYLHHQLLREGDGEKLAKRRDSESLAALRAQGLSAAQLREMAGF